MSLESRDPSQLLRAGACVGYVVKRYPRYSETFIVNEILAHEAAGLDVEVFSLLPPNDTHFQDSISRVRAPVTYLTTDALKAADLWRLLQEQVAAGAIAWGDLEAARGDEVRELYSALLLARLVRLRGITHLHAHFATSATSVARMAARFARVPYTFTAHAKDIFHDDVRHDDLTRKLTDAAATVTVSDFNVTHLSHTFGAAAASRVVRIYNGMDLGRLLYAAPDERAPVIVTAGRLVEKKGFNDLVDACAELARQGVAFSCQIIGTGDLEQNLREQITRLNLSECVHLLGPRPQREVFELIQRAAVFAAPCVVGADNNMDGLPTVLLESMALGTPCVSTDVTGIPEVVIDDETGLLVPQHAPERLADACRRLLDDAALRVRLARRARQLIEEEFDVARNTARLRDVFARSSATARSPVIDVIEPAVVTAAAEPVEAA